jgi:hypothetical protein
MPTGSDELKSLRTKVEAEIDKDLYRLPEGAIGNPWPSDRVSRTWTCFKTGYKVLSG